MGPKKMAREEDKDDEATISKKPNTKVSHADLSLDLPLSTSRPILVVLPGASGHIAANMMNLVLTPLSMKLSLKTTKFNWNKMRAGDAKNIAQVSALCPSDAPFFVLGNSFGNRVICEMLAVNQVTNCKGVIMCGYPLYGPEKQTTKEGLCTDREPRVNPRVAQLLSVPADARVLLISGTRDEFLCRPYLSKPGPDSLKEVVSQHSGSMEVVTIPNGTHDVPTVKGAGAKQATLVAANSVLHHISKFCGV